MSAAVVRLSWKPAFRLLPYRTQAGSAYARIAEERDLDALRALADFTDPLMRDAAGAIALFVPEQRPANGARAVMAAFAHPPAPGGRFAGGFRGVLVAARERATAIAEAAGHSASFLRATREDPMALPMRLDHVDVEGDFIDARMLPDDAWPRQWQAGADGVLFRGAQRPGGDCVAVFKPALAQYRGEAARLLLEWDGEKIAEVYEKIPLA